MQCQNVLCIRSTAKQAWVPVPLKNDVVALTATRSPWAIRFLTTGTKNKQRDPGECGLALKAFEKELRNRSGQPSVDDDAEEPTPTPKKQRAGGCALNDDSDDENESSPAPSSATGLHESDGEDERSAASTKKRKTDNSKTEGATLKLQLKGPCGKDGPIVLVGFGKGPGLLLKADPANVLATLKSIDEQFDRLATAGRSLQFAKTTASSQEPGAMKGNGQQPSGCFVPLQQSTKPESSSDANKIRFDMKAGGYIIHYHDENLKRHRLSAGFLVPRSDWMDKPLAGAEYAAAKDLVYKKAQAKWNSLDLSKEKRYTV